MEGVIEVVLHAGRDAVDVSLYTLLPIMVVMMILLRLLEASGILDRVIRLVSPAAKPFGLTGIAVLAMEGLGNASLRAAFTGREVDVAVPDATLFNLFW